MTAIDTVALLKLRLINLVLLPRTNLHWTYNRTQNMKYYLINMSLFKADVLRQEDTSEGGLRFSAQRFVSHAVPAKVLVRSFKAIVSYVTRLCDA